MIPAPEGKGVEQAVSLGSAGDSCMCWVGVQGDMFTKCCPAILPGSRSELHPAPPSSPWKHGSKGKGYNSSQIHPSPPPRPVLKALEPWSLYPAASRGGTEPFCALEFLSSGPPSPASGVSVTLAVLRLGNPSPTPLLGSAPPLPCPRTQYFYCVKSRDLAGAGGARSGNKSLLTWAKLDSMNFPFWQLEEEG